MDEVEDGDRSYESVIWVAASTPQDKTIKSHDIGSAYGPLIDLFAPGEAVKSATHRGDSDNSNAEYWGTSFVSHDNRGTLITTNSLQLHHTLRRLPTSLESSHVCLATIAIGALPQRT